MGNKTFLKVSYGFVVSLLVLISFDDYTSRGIWYDLLWLLVPIVWSYNVYRFCKHIDKHLVEKSAEDNDKPRFKIGDRVRLSASSPDFHSRKDVTGKIGTVLEDDDVPYVQFDGLDYKVAFLEEYLELVP